MLGVFLAIAVLADFKQLRLSYHATQSTAVATNFACALVYGPAAAVWVSAAGAITADLLHRKPLYKGLFNSSAIALAVASGSFAFEALRAPNIPAVSPDDLPAHAAYAATNIVVNLGLVCTVIGLTTRSRPWDVFATNFRGLLLPFMALFPLGVLMAVTYVHFGGPLGLVLLTVPTVAVYSALDNAQQLRVHTRAALEALADAIDRRDHYTAEHSRRVAEYAARIGSVLRLSPEQRDVIISAARVHDVGKISVPDAVLLKPGALTAEEMEVMKRHPAAGADILARLPMYREGAKLVSFHHERLDGEGYPHSLADERVPIGARVIAVADSFDAMTSDRPYRKAMPAAVALTRLRAGVGSQFSAEVVDALAEALGLITAPASEATPSVQMRQASA